MRLRTLPAATLLATLLASACTVGPTVPIYGVWEGNPPGPAVVPSKLVDLVLEGGPGATSGHYRIATTIRGDLQFGSGDQNTRWEGQWTSIPVLIQGSTVPVITLHNSLVDDISHYALASNGVLIPVKPDNQPYPAIQGKIYGLSPVPRSSHNYGTL